MSYIYIKLRLACTLLYQTYTSCGCSKTVLVKHTMGRIWTLLKTEIYKPQYFNRNLIDLLISIYTCISVNLITAKGDLCINM